MRILLAYPEFPKDTFWGFEQALSLSGRRSTMPPLGLLTVAGAFPIEDFELVLADENVAPIDDGTLCAADLVLASAMVVQRASLERLVARCRRLGVPIVVGGPLVSACYQELQGAGLRPRSWVIGEAEALLPALIQDLSDGGLRRAYGHVTTPGEVERLEGVFGSDVHVVCAERPELDSAPVPRFDLLDLDAYHSMAVQASRGCPIGCEFCDIWQQFGLRSRTRSPERLLEELDYLFSLGWRGRVFVVDDNFIGHVGAVRQLLPELRRWQEGPKRFYVPREHRAALGPKRLHRLERRARRSADRRNPFAFCTEADARLGSTAPKMTELREGMAAAGFGSVFLGLETPSAESLRGAGKQVNVGKEESTAEHLLSCVRRIQGAGMQVMSGFIVGFDDDPRDIDAAMIDFIERSAIPVAMVGLLAVVPGSALEARLQREGRLLQRSRGAQTHDMQLGFVPVGRSAERVVAQYARVLDAVYGDMEGYYRRCQRALAALPRAPQTGDGVGWRELRALALSLVRLRPRRAYWRFLLRVLTRRPRFFAAAVVLAMQGAHLHDLTVRKLREYEGARAESERDARSGGARPDAVPA